MPSVRVFLRLSADSNYHVRARVYDSTLTAKRFAGERKRFYIFSCHTKAALQVYEKYSVLAFPCVALKTTRLHLVRRRTNARVGLRKNPTKPEAALAADIGLDPCLDEDLREENLESGNRDIFRVDKDLLLELPSSASA